MECAPFKSLFIYAVCAGFNTSAGYMSPDEQELCFVFIFNLHGN